MGENIATIDRLKPRKGIILECRSCGKEVSAVLKSVEYEIVRDHGLEKQVLIPVFEDKKGHEIRFNLVLREFYETLPLSTPPITTIS